MGSSLYHFDNKSAAFFCVDTVKYCSIPSVRSGQEGVKTRPPWPRRRTGEKAGRRSRLTRCTHSGKMVELKLIEIIGVVVAPRLRCVVFAPRRRYHTSTSLTPPQYVFPEGATWRWLAPLALTLSSRYVCRRSHSPCQEHTLPN